MVRKRWLPIALVALVGCAMPALADETMWKRLESGGRVVLVRHAITTPGVGDPEGMRLDDCRTQRNLTDAGRAHARAIGEAFRARKVPVDRVLSSPWCRCVETAELAFGRAERSAALGNLFGRSEQVAAQVAAMRALVASHRTGGNLLLVSHGSTIVALTGISPATGEMVIVTRSADGFTVDGRLSVAVP